MRCLASARGCSYSNTSRKATQPAAIKEAAGAAAQFAVAQRAAPSGQGPRGIYLDQLAMAMALAPAHWGKGLQQASKAYRQHGALQECAGPADGVWTQPGAAGPHLKAQGAGPPVAAAQVVKKSTNKPENKKTKKTKTLRRLDEKLIITKSKARTAHVRAIVAWWPRPCPGGLA